MMSRRPFLKSIVLLMALISIFHVDPDIWCSSWQQSWISIFKEKVMKREKERQIFLKSTLILSKLMNTLFFFCKGGSAIEAAQQSYYLSFLLLILCSSSMQASNPRLKKLMTSACFVPYHHHIKALKMMWKWKHYSTGWNTRCYYFYDKHCVIALKAIEVIIWQTFEINLLLESFKPKYRY